MHELSAAQSILEITLRYAEGQQVTDIQVVVGQLSSFLDDSIQFYWDIISCGSPAEGATLHFTRIPAQMCCQSCGKSYPLTGDFSCPHCGGKSGRLAAGLEFFVESINVEDEARITV